MLVVSRLHREFVDIEVPPGVGCRIRVGVASIRPNSVRLGIDAPKDVRIVRAELEQRERAESRAKVASGKDGD